MKKWLKRLVVVVVIAVAAYNLKTIGSLLGPVESVINSKVVIDQNDAVRLAQNPGWKRVTTIIFRLYIISFFVGALIQVIVIDEIRTKFDRNLHKKKYKFTDGLFVKRLPKKYGLTVWIIFLLPWFVPTDLALLFMRDTFRTIEEILTFQIIPKNLKNSP